MPPTYCNCSTMKKMKQAGECLQPIECPNMRIELWCRDPPFKSVQLEVPRFTLKAITSLPFCYIVRSNVPITGKRGVIAWRKSEIRVFLYGSTLLGQSVGWTVFVSYLSVLCSKSLPPLMLFNRHHNVCTKLTLSTYDCVCLLLV